LRYSNDYLGFSPPTADSVFVFWLHVAKDIAFQSGLHNVIRQAGNLHHQHQGVLVI
jgi:hypothetical protein